MGKIQGIFQFTGKIGQVVGMKGDNGERYAREYVKEIANPDTEEQQVTRTKLSLAGKISSLTPADLITGMEGGNRRNRRSAFVRNIVLNSTVTVEDGEKVAKLPADQLVLSEGERFPQVTLTTSIAGGVLSVTPGSFPKNVDAIIVVAYGIDDNDNYVDCQYVTIPSTATDPQTITLGNGSTAATVYQIPVYENPGASKQRYQSALESLENDTEFAVRSGGYANSALAYGQSSYNGSVKE